MNRRDLLKGVVGTSLVSVVPQASGILVPGKKDLVVAVTDVKPICLENHPFKHIVSWEEINRDRMKILAVKFLTESTEEFEVCRDILKTGTTFAWRLPLYSFRGVDYHIFKGEVLSLKMVQEPDSYMTGKLLAKLF